MPALAVQYADYAVWQRDRYDAGAFDSQLQYWRDKLQDAPPFLNVPTDYPRPQNPTFSRQSHRFTLDRSTLDSVLRASASETVTPFMFFVAAFNLLLSRLADRTDILIGTDALNCDRPETQGLIGFFINQLVLRTDLAGCDTFRDLLRSVRSTSLEAYANQELPFNKIVEMLRPPRDRERPPIYQVKLAYSRGVGAPDHLDDLPVEWIPCDKGTAHLDLTLFLREHADGVFGRLEFRDELFVPATVASMTAEYVRLVQTFACDPDWLLSERATNIGVDAESTAASRRMAIKDRLLKSATKNGPASAG